MPRPSSRLLSLPLALLLTLLAALAAAPLAAAAPEEFTPVTASVVSPPQPVAASDGRVHLAYELLVINRSFAPPAKVTLRRVEALAGGKVVESLSGKALASVTAPFGADEPTATLNRGEAGFVLMDVSLPRGAKLPRHLVHRISISLQPAREAVATSYRAAPTSVVRQPAPVVAPPLRGDGWIVGNGCCAELTSHRAGLLPVNGSLSQGERFAIDFIQVQPSGLLGTGPLDQLSSYPFFGDEVIAAAPGKVVTAVGNRPETPPGDLPPSTAAHSAGNHVVVAMGQHRYALYAHLQPGSLTVKPGDHVRTGQLLGRLGSSGNSNAPHLHFQLMDGPSPLASEGIPYRFSRFSVAGTLMNFGGLFEGKPAQVKPQFAGPHRAELPLNQQVIGFG
ncbi:MAG TPA: M23 family metallopeptidase [Solirubrobacterales bacterium]|nr:M23 family metallopeptidase [Solirubrobacterales bacterium]